MHLLSDVRYAVRQLRRSPGFAITAVLTLALGIGASTAIFSVVDAVLLRPLPFQDPARIVALETYDTAKQHVIPRVVGGDYQDMQAEPAFAAVAYYFGGEMGVQLADHSTFTQVAAVSPSFPSVFGTTPIAGTLFNEAGASHQALVSAAFADAELGGPGAAVGKLVSVESQSYQVTGVLPNSFDFPRGAGIWLQSDGTPANLNRDSFNYRAVARVRDTVSIRQAQSHLDALSHRLAATYPVSHAHLQLRAVPLIDALTSDVRNSLWLWLAAVSMLLLIACANVAHLQLVRVSAQSQSLAIRCALGATRLRVVGNVLLQAALVSLLGGGCGVLLAFPVTRWLLHLLSPELARSVHASVDPRLVAFSPLLTCAVALVSAVLPCWWAIRRYPAAALGRITQFGGTDRGTAIWRRTLVVLETALSFVLATTAGLLLHTLVHIHESPLGFAAANRLVIYAHGPARGLAEAQRRVTELAQLTGDLRTLPGVESAAQTMGLPAGQYGSNGYYAVQSKGQTMGQSGLPWANFSLAGPGYFDTMHIPLLRGRDVTAQDTYRSQPVVVISAALARQSFGEVDPVGQRIICGLDEDSMRGATVVGVVGDVRQDSPADDPTPALYLPLAQHPYLANEVQIVLRTASAPSALIPAVRQRVLATDASIAVRFTTMDDALSKVTAPQQMRGALLTAFAGLALVVAAVGIYSVTSYTVSQQTREIGIRMALGADRIQIARNVMHAAARNGLLGILLGGCASLVVGGLLTRFLTGVVPTDPLSYGVAAAILLLMVALAALVPAYRAASIEPVVALRTE